MGAFTAKLLPVTQNIGNPTEASCTALRFYNFDFTVMIANLELLDKSAVDALCQNTNPALRKSPVKLSLEPRHY